MRLYQFASISARCFPTINDINNPWIFLKDVAIVINVSKKFDSQIAKELETKGIEYCHFPIYEEVDDIGWENIKKVVELLLKYDAEEKRMVVHCDYGQHRSRLVVEAFYFAKYGKHFVDEYKGYDNRIIYNCKMRYLPLLEKVEQELLCL